MRRRSEELDLQKYDIDKIADGYLQVYDPICAPPIEQSVKLLELGVRTDRGRQEDIALLLRIAANMAPDGFDIIIDDASHVAGPTQAWKASQPHYAGMVGFIKEPVDEQAARDATWYDESLERASRVKSLRFCSSIAIATLKLAPLDRS
jgi:hypothetical protein